MNEKMRELEQRLATLEGATLHTALLNAGGEQAYNSVIGVLLASAPAAVQQTVRANLDLAFEVLAQQYPAENVPVVQQGFLQRARSLIVQYQPGQP